MIDRILKRMLDLSISVVGGVICLPVLIFAGLIVWAKIGVPIIFRQTRPGKNGKPFILYKFKTMTDDIDIDGDLLPDANRLTSHGKFLRSTSLDELPELFNVFKGDMSIVGPRPLLVQYLDRYTPEQARRHDVLPGITGWAQVNGRNALRWEDKFVLDVWYVDNCSLWLDIKIIFMTIKKVLIREGISAAGEVTMPEFQRGTKMQIRKKSSA